MAHIAYKHETGYPPYPYVVSTLFEELFCTTHLSILYEQCRKEIKAARAQMVRDEVRKIMQEEFVPFTGSVRDNFR